MNKNIIAIIVGLIIIFGAVVLSGVEIDFSSASGPEVDNSQDVTQLIDCLEDNNLVIYGAKYCGACQQLVASLGGYESVESIYVECSEEGTVEEKKQCRENAKTGYVPEIQIDGEVYEGSRSLSALGAKVGCEY